MAAYRVEWPAWADWYATSGTPTRAQVSGALGGGHVGALNADGVYIEYQVVVAAGTYTLTLLYVVSANAAKFQMSIDGTDVGALTDAYGAVTTYNNVYTATGIALTEGVHTVRMTANGKNASAAAYYIFPQWFSLERTGA